MLIPEFRNQLAQAKGSLPKTLHGAGNTAIAKVEIEGLDTKTLAAHSRINIAQNGFIGNGKSQFNALVIPNNRGIDINRAVDSEYKIFSNVSDLLGNRYNAKGNLTIFTERHACKICLGVADQFKKQYQNININIYIFDNNGSMVIPK